MPTDIPDCGFRDFADAAQVRDALDDALQAGEPIAHRPRVLPRAASGGNIASMITRSGRGSGCSSCESQRRATAKMAASVLFLLCHPARN